MKECKQTCQKREDLLSRLEKYCEEDYVPLHMPGAKRNTKIFSMGNPYGIDITEIDGFDNLHHATEIISDSMREAAQVFGADETLYLINGSSAGILSAICGVTSRGDKILVARNCHVSVYNAIYMNGLVPVYYYPDCDPVTGIYDGVNVEEIGHCVEKNPDIKAVVITSPTYEGNVSDIKAIAKYLHDRNIVFIVDEAHGAHFHMSEAFPQSAVELGADAVIQSIHKTLPAFTQTALLHLNGDIINRDRVKMYWNIYQTTSPSYILMAGIDRCVGILKEQGSEMFLRYTHMLKALRKRLEKLENIHLHKTDDISKIVLVVDTYWCGGKWLYEVLLKKYHIQLEMVSMKYVIAMTSIGDKQEYYDRFADALEEIDAMLFTDEAVGSKFNCKEKSDTMQICMSAADMVMTPSEAIDRLTKEGGELVSLENVKGRVSAVSVCMYPPGIPVVNYGEKVTQEIVEILESGISAGLEVMGLKEGKILCLK